MSGDGRAEPAAAAKNDEPKGDSSRKRLVERIFAIIGAASSLVGIIGAAVIGVNHVPLIEMRHEEAMVSSLVPGDDYAKMTELIGAQPDYHKSLTSNQQIYVFSRRWEWIQLLVNATGEVLSVGVYAKTSSFKPRLTTGIVLNGQSAGKQLGGYPVSADGDCGASWGFYYQEYITSDFGFSHSVIVGLLPIRSEANQIGSLCEALGSERRCLPGRESSYSPLLSSSFLKCFSSSEAGKKVVEDLRPGIIIVAAPNQTVSPNMMNQEYFGYYL